MVKPRHTTADIALAIRDHCETKLCYHYDEAGEEHEPAQIDYFDVSDANNPVVFLTNGQQFQIRIFAI